MRQIIGTDAVRENLPGILSDESRFESGVPAMVCFPETTTDLQNALRDASQQGMQVTLVGGQTGTTGGAVPLAGTCAIVFSEMNRIDELRWGDGQAPVLFCGPGITLDSLQRFLADPASWRAAVPGSEGLAPAAFFFPPDPTETSAQLGGMVSTNASGARSYRFGPTRRYIASLDLVLASGETLTLMRSGDQKPPWNGRLVTDQGTAIDIPALPYTNPAVKNAAGYFNASATDPLDLFIGSEGTLAAIARVGIALRPAPAVLSGLTFFDCSISAFDFADFLRGEPAIAAIEFFDHGSLRFIDRYRSRLPNGFPQFPTGARSALLWEYIEEHPGSFECEMERWETALGRCGSSFEATWSGFDDQEKARLRYFRHALPEMINRVIAENKRSCGEIRKIGTDSAFPAEAFRSSYFEMMRRIEQSDLACAAFGHLGDHHLHINLVPATARELACALQIYDELMAVALRNGGTVSAEHGIGKIKKKYLRAMYGDAGIDAMRKVKAALDPQGMLNPGNLF